MTNEVLRLPAPESPLLLESPTQPEPMQQRHEFAAYDRARFDLPIGADGKPRYAPVVDAQEAARQTGFEAPVALHFHVGGTDFAFFDLRGYPRDQKGFRQVPVHMPDGHLRSTLWNAEFLITSAEFVASLESGDEHIRGVLGLRTARTQQDNVLFGADNPKCQSNFALPDDFPGSCFRVSYNEVPDGKTQHQTLWFVALGPITVTRAEQGQNVLRDTGDNQAIQDQPDVESEPATEEVTDGAEATDGVAAAEGTSDDASAKPAVAAHSGVEPTRDEPQSGTADMATGPATAAAATPDAVTAAKLEAPSEQDELNALKAAFTSGITTASAVEGIKRNGMTSKLLARLPELAADNVNVKDVIDELLAQGSEVEVVDNLPQVAAIGITPLSIARRLLQDSNTAGLVAARLPDFIAQAGPEVVFDFLLGQGREWLVEARLDQFLQAGLPGSHMTDMMLAHNLPLDTVFNHLDHLTHFGQDLYALERLADRDFFADADGFSRLSAWYPWLAGQSDVRELLRQYHVEGVPD